MPSPTDSPSAWFALRDKPFWLVLGAIAAAQLLAFWLLCSHQVRKAEARRSELQVQQMALAACLQYIPGSTIASCNARPAAAPQAVAVAPSGAMPVGYIYR